MNKLIYFDTVSYGNVWKIILIQEQKKMLEGKKEGTYEISIEKSIRGKGEKKSDRQNKGDDMDIKIYTGNI